MEVLPKASFGVLILEISNDYALYYLLFPQNRGFSAEGAVVALLYPHREFLAHMEIRQALPVSLHAAKAPCAPHPLHLLNPSSLLAALPAYPPISHVNCLAIIHLTSVHLIWPWLCNPLHSIVPQSLTCTLAQRHLKLFMGSHPLR